MTDLFDPPFWLEKVRTCIRAELKRLKKRSKIGFSAILCLLSHLFHQVFGIEFNFEVTDITTMVSQYRKNPLFLRNSRFFFWHRRFSKSTGYMDFYSQKGVMPDLEQQSEFDVGVFFSWNVWVKICRNRPTFFCADAP